MADKHTKTDFEAWVAKATQRLEDKRIPRKRRLYVPSIDEEITIRSLTTREIADVTDSDNEDSLRQDKRAVYTARRGAGPARAGKAAAGGWADLRPA